MTVVIHPGHDMLQSTFSYRSFHSYPSDKQCSLPKDHVRLAYRASTAMMRRAVNGNAIGRPTQPEAPHTPGPACFYYRALAVELDQVRMRRSSHEAHEPLHHIYRLKSVLQRLTYLMKCFVLVKQLRDYEHMQV